MSLKIIKNSFVAILIFLVYACSLDKAADSMQTAVNYKNIGRYDLAVDSYITFLRSYPENKLVAEALFNLAGIYYYQLHDTNQAIKYYNQIVRKYQNSTYYQSALLSLSEIYDNGQTQNIKSAINSYNSLLATKSLDLNSWVLAKLKLSEIYIKTNQYEFSRSQLKTIIEKLDSNKDYIDVISYCYFKIAETFEFENYKNLSILGYKMADDVAGNSKASLPAAIKLANLYDDTNQMAKAQVVFKSILLRLNPEDKLYNIYKSKIN